MLQTIRLTQNPLETQLLNRMSFKTQLQMMMSRLYRPHPDVEELFVPQTFQST